MRWHDLILRDLVNLFQCKWLYHVSFHCKTKLHADFQCFVLSYFIMACWDINHFLLLCPQAIYSFIMLLLNFSLVSCMLAVTRSYVYSKETYKMGWMVVLQKTDNVLYFGGSGLLPSKLWFERELPKPD